MLNLIIGFILGVLLMCTIGIEKDRSYKKGYETAKKEHSEKPQ